MSRTGVTCPGCDRDDLVQAVPAAYLAGRDAVTRRERDRDGDMRTVTRTVTSGLSDALAPVPAPPAYGLGGLGAFACVVSIGTFLGGAIGGKWFHEGAAHEPPEFGAWHLTLEDVPAGPPPAYEFLGWISALAFVVAVLAFAVVVRRRAAFTRITRRRHEAEELWSHGWYCHRCGTAHFEDVPGEDRSPLTLQRFREKVWDHGGYGALAARQRAVDAGRS